MKIIFNHRVVETMDEFVCIKLECTWIVQKNQDLNQIKSIHIEPLTCICTLRDQHRNNNKAILAVNSVFTWFYIFFFDRNVIFNTALDEFFVFYVLFCSIYFDKMENTEFFLNIIPRSALTKNLKMLIFNEITMQIVRYTEKSHKYGSMS